MDKRVSEILKEHGINSINGERFQLETHEMDNRIIFEFDDILGNRSTTDIIGYSEHPAYDDRSDSVAVMFQDIMGWEFWCHIPDVFFELSNVKKVFKIEN